MTATEKFLRQKVVGWIVVPTVPIDKWVRRGGVDLKQVKKIGTRKRGKQACYHAKTGLFITAPARSYHRLFLPRNNVSAHTLS